MKAVLLAAGLGTRLRPITLTTPKCLIPFEGIPLLEIWLRQLESAGIEEALINLHHLPDQVQQFVDQRKGIIEIHTAYEPNLLGSLGSLLYNRKFYQNEDSIFVGYADNLVSAVQEKLITDHSGHEFPVTMAVFETSQPEQCGIVEIDERNVVRGFVEKPEKPTINLANAGLYVIDTSILTEFETSGEELLDIGFDLLPKLINQMVAIKYDGYIQDVGNLERYKGAQEYFRERHDEFF